MLFPRVCLSAKSKYGKRNWYLLVLVRRIGITLELDRSKASANCSPNAAFMINFGIEKIVGLDKTLPNIFVKSELLTGLGATAFIGPIIDSFAITCKIIPSKSSSQSRLMY